MTAIRILSDRVANQIAAGEVIERPVAVVKELIENSIDAGATRIEVEFRNGGKSYIRIEDNGKGMSPDESMLSLERHATSKIREAADLNEIISFGFRGEALPSIASVSRFTLRTRDAGWDYGTEIHINGGKIIDKKDCGMPVGTVIEVANLFNSVPARRKFLKTEPTETAHITYTCRLFAVAHPEIAFRVLENGRTVFQSPACPNLKDRISEIWGPQMAADLIPVEAEDKDRGYRLSGLTAKPGVGRSTRRELITLVNRRPIDSRTLGFAVLDAYHGQIQKGRYPPAFLFFEIRPQEIDVNVHPAKREIRFRDDGSVRRFILQAITDTLSAQKQTLPHKSEPSPANQPTPQIRPEIPLSTPSPERSHSIHPQRVSPEPPASSAPSKAAQVATETKHVTHSTEIEQATKAPHAPVEAPQNEAFTWEFISTFQKRYALFNAPRGLIMLHLRHADQRVRYERILRETGTEEAPSQSLLIPIPLELEPLAKDTLTSQMGLLSKNGFRIEAFGRNFFRIEAIPTWIGEAQAETFIRDLIDQIRRGGTQRKATAVAIETVARLAVAGSYRSDDPRSSDAVTLLAKALLECDSPHTSPFGKPTFQEISWNEWARKFGGE